MLIHPRVRTQERSAQRTRSATPASIRKNAGRDNRLLSEDLTHFRGQVVLSSGIMEERWRYSFWRQEQVQPAVHFPSWLYSGNSAHREQKPRRFGVSTDNPRSELGRGVVYTTSYTSHSVAPARSAGLRAWLLASRGGSSHVTVISGILQAVFLRQR